MDSTISPEALATRKRLGFLQVLSGFLFFISLTLPDPDQVKTFIPDHQVQWGISLGLILLRWSSLVVLILLSHRLRQIDELQLLISRQAFVFAFYGLLFGAFLIDQLQSAALIPMFGWTTHRMAVAMIVLWLTGLAWSKLRYR